MPNLYVEGDGIVPTRGTTGAACYDVYAKLDEPAWLAPGMRMLIPTGLKMCCDPGYFIALYPRSGLAVKQGLSLINCVGIIDADYRDYVMVPVINHGAITVQINNTDRIAQLMIQPVLPIEIVQGLPPTDSDRRGGFGSTGK